MSETILSDSKILILDDDLVCRGELEKILISQGYEVFSVSACEDGKKYLDQFSVDLVLVEVLSNEKKGLFFIEELRKDHAHLPVIIFTADESFHTIKKSIKLGISDYINKPLNSNELLNSIRKAIHEYQQTLRDQKILRNSEYRFEELRTLNNENAWLYEKLQNKARELERVNKELLQLDQMKSDFISNISHEIRTPLTSINGYAELLIELKQGLSPKEERDFLQAILDSGRHLSTIIDQIAEFGVVESGGMKWDIKPTSLHSAIRRVLNRFRFKLKEKQIDLLYQPFDETIQVYADEKKIDQVLYHFIDNAVKFNREKGKVSIKIESLEPSGNKIPPFVKVSIIDTGAGISKEDLSHIFTKFTQLGNILTEKPAGLGLGLALCKEIIQHHQGEIGVESEPGKGSTFYFTLPIVGGDILSIKSTET
jgi:signal transduction histidine kinase